MRRILWIVAFVALVALGVRWYRHRAQLRALDSGAVYVKQPNGPAKPLTALQSKPAQSLPNQEIATTTPPAPVVPQPVTAPSGDTIARNPPNGLAFAGSGKFQLYRQGDITWRLNTDTGDACIIFATDAQWHRTRVYQNGCASRGQTRD
jgi:hypothetical protein